jgi:hypothetical protein
MVVKAHLPGDGFHAEVGGLQQVLRLFDAHLVQVIRYGHVIGVKELTAKVGWGDAHFIRDLFDSKVRVSIALFQPLNYLAG